MSAEDGIQSYTFMGPSAVTTKKLENCVSPNLRVGEVMAVPTTSYLLCDTNYPENTFASIYFN